jgi:hypothetical protein
LKDSLVAASQLLETVIALLLQVGLLLHLCLVETVDNGILALRYEYALNFAGILEADLANFHAAVLLEVGPWGVDDCDVVFLVSW